MQPTRAADLPERAAAVLATWLGKDFASQPATSWPPPSQTAVWFKGGPEVDQMITQRFAGDVEALASGAYEGWLQQPLATVAGIILADQFTRNIHRGTAAAFSLDAKALAWSQHLRDTHGDRLAAALPSPAARYFSYMPLMHSEALADQELLVALVGAELAAARTLDAGSPAARSWADVLAFAEAHRGVIARWGRFPHRNALLGRESTSEETAGLAAGSIPRW